VVGVKRNTVQSQAERGVQMQVVPDATLKKEELAIKIDGTIITYSIVSDIHYSIYEV
jgi:carbamoylphosphate synthase small subunit